MSPGHTVLPFAKLNYAQFEAFLFEMLSSGLRVEVAARPRHPAKNYRVVNAAPYGGAGHKQKGIDFLCTMDDGSEWALQAKLMPKFGSDDAKAAVKKARKEFPKAKRHVLLVSGTAHPNAIDYVRRQPHWEIWDGPVLTAYFLRRIPTSDQIAIIGRAWPSLAAQLVAELYPLRDQVLVTPGDFFANWLKPERLFHHRSTLVGHSEVLDGLSAFVRDPGKRVAILVAPGGRGKSRLLRAFADRVGAQHPDFTIRFVDPLASAEAQPHGLRTAGETQFIVVQDDAHRAETLRHDLLAILASTQGKLLLAARPQAIASLEELVVRLGFSSHQVHAPITLPKLKLRDYEALAFAELEPKHRHHAKFLARMGRDCPLVITVGAALINRDLIAPDKFEERHFRNEVYARFEGDELDRLGGAHPRQRVREVLQTIAVLAPWLEREVESSTVAAFIGCTEAELAAVLRDLEAGQLVLRTGRGRRVVPDLFADHLVYAACYRDDGTLTDYAQRLAATFAATASQNMLRNISEADWRALQYHPGKKPSSLLDPFWQSVWDQFTKSDFMTRAQLIERWAAHSVYQPARSLELCELAIHLRDAPAPPASPLLKGETGSRLNSRQWVLDHIPAVLEPIAIFHEEYRERCLDVLLGLAAEWPANHGLGDKNHPWAAIGRVATFKEQHPVSASQGVLAWIEKRIADVRFKPALAQPNGILEKILSPVFARQFDASYSEGNTFHFVHPPVNVRQTQPMRDQALRIITEQILPCGEIATLNILPVLNDGSQGFYATMGGKFDDATMRHWEPERLKALAIFRQIAKDCTGRVGWKIRTLVRHTHRGETAGSKVHRETGRVLRLLPFTGDLRDVALCCSSAWQEMDDEPFGEGSASIKERKVDVNQRWATAVAASVTGFLARFRTPPRLLGGLEKLFLDCKAAGFNPNPFALLNGFGSRDPKLTRALVNLLLKKKHSPLLYAWTQLLAGSIRFPDRWLEETSLRVLRGDDYYATVGLLSFLSSAVSGPLPAAVRQGLHRWARSARGPMANLAISHLRIARGADDAFWMAIGPHLSLRRLTPEQITGLGEALSSAMQYSDLNVPDPLLRSVITEFVRVSDMRFERGYDFLGLMGTRFPRDVFDLYQNRILLAERKKLPVYHTMPMNPPALDKLPETKGYAQLVRQLFKAVRTRPRKQRWAWSRLLQCAVIEVSPLAVPGLEAWAQSARSMDELEGISSLFSFEGSLYLLRQPALTRALLQRGREIDPANYPRWEARLAATMGPVVHSFTNGKRDAGQDYLSVEVNKLISAGGVPSDLQSFYAAVIKHDQSWAVGRMPDPDDD
ncbi:MAG: hypothetical protein ACOZE5_18285 [Verrucomicrobiota bacterium]